MVKAEQLCGVIDHRDVFFNEEEKLAGTNLCVCVSRVASRPDAEAVRPSLSLEVPKAQL